MRYCNPEVWLPGISFPRTFAELADKKEYILRQTRLVVNKVARYSNGY